MPKTNLTDRALRALKPAKRGARYEIMDKLVPGFGVRVTDKADKGKAAQRTFILVARFPGSRNPTRRALGAYGELTLEQARDKARSWHELIRRGIDPAEEERRAERTEAAKRATTFGAVMEDYIARHLKGKRKAADAEREIRRELVPAWGNRPVTEITRSDVVKLIEAITDRPAPYQAHNVLGHIRTFFNWAINRGSYGLEASPCDRLKPAQLIAPKKPRQRTLTDAELVAFWQVTGELAYPFGSMFRLLAITGQRKRDVAEALWSEFDLPNKRWVIPAARYKSEAPHIVPLSDEAVAILKSLPRFNRGDYIFSTTFGEKPISSFSKAKARLDRQMLRSLKTIEPFVIHDLRRTVRTRLASLRVSDVVAEMVIGHGRKGLQRVYDQHTYEPEMREALELWAARLRDIVTPPPANVVALPKRAKK